LQPRPRLLVWHGRRDSRSQRPLTPCAHRLGEPTRSQTLGRALSSRCLTRQPPGLPSLVRETRDPCLRSGLAPANVSLHAPSTVSMGSITGQQDYWTPSPRGAHRPFDLRSPEHPCRAREGSSTSSRSAAFSVAVRRLLAGPRGLPRIRRQDASNTVSTTDVTRHEHPPENTSFGDPPPDSRG
jgi:hypothetical protein